MSKLPTGDVSHLCANLQMVSGNCVGTSKLTRLMLAAKFGEVELEVSQGVLPRHHSSDMFPAGAASQQRLHELCVVW